jgi:succinyl-CoA synthetase alpha subunit
MIERDTHVIIQGMAEQVVEVYVGQMIESGVNVVGGVMPGQGGEWLLGKPVFETVQNGVNATGANTSVIFVPPLQAADAIYEAIDAGIALIVCVTGNIPLLDMVRVREYIRYTPSRLVGPNCPGVAVPGIGSVGIIPVEIMLPGRVGVVSRSRSLLYEVTYLLTVAGKGQRLVMGTGADTVAGTSFVDMLRWFEEDANTDAVVLLGEIGGTMENQAAEYIQAHMTKPVTAYVAGIRTPSNVMIAHRGTTVKQVETTAEYKIEQLEGAGCRVVRSLEMIPAAV